MTLFIRWLEEAHSKDSYARHSHVSRQNGITNVCSALRTVTFRRLYMYAHSARRHTLKQIF